VIRPDKEFWSNSTYAYLVMIEEYIHVLQYRAEGGLVFADNYLHEKKEFGYDQISYETHAGAIRKIYQENPWLIAQNLQPWNLNLSVVGVRNSNWTPERAARIVDMYY
jgi:hypothetical protein